MRTDPGSLRLVALLWLLVGTLGLLLDAFVIDLGWIAILASVAVDLVGLAILGYSLALARRESNT